MNCDTAIKTTKCLIDDLDESRGKTKYEKPLFEESKELAFPREVWEKFNGGKGCMQCAGCHACR